MAGFSELIRKFDKIRLYMHDFYIYGFRSRNDFTKMSPRTYDNEKRRIESFLGDYMKWEYTATGKRFFISLDSARISTNPLYAAWKSKAFTNNDIMLHFYILDDLQCNPASTITEITDRICQQSGQVFDVQTVRNKCNEYVTNDLLASEKNGKTILFSRNVSYPLPRKLQQAVAFFQGVSPLGEVGSFIMDRENFDNQLFVFKHNYIAHTLDSEQLLEILSAIKQQKAIRFTNESKRNDSSSKQYIVPLRIMISSTTGRRYLCAYSPDRMRFHSFRLDNIKEIQLRETDENISELQEKLDSHLEHVWNVGFDGKMRIEIVCLKLLINEEKEQYIIDRIYREGKGGELLNLGENIFLYTKEVYDSNEMLPWIKTFTGRILSLECSNQTVYNKFYDDMKRLEEMYL